MFLTSGVFVAPNGTLPSTVFTVSMVGGGGGGGGAEGTGGGGGGGYNDAMVSNLTRGVSYKVTVGKGGVPGKGYCGSWTDGSPSGGPHGLMGTPSVFLNLTATGGKNGYGRNCAEEIYVGAGGVPGGRPGTSFRDYVEGVPVKAATPNTQAKEGVTAALNIALAVLGPGPAEVDPGVVGAVRPVRAVRVATAASEGPGTRLTAPDRPVTQRQRQSQRQQ